MRKFLLPLAAYLILGLGLMLSQVQITSANGDLIVRDALGRTLNDQEIVVLDWEGYLANPLTHLTLEVPAGSPTPLSVSVSANHSRLYFDQLDGIGVNLSANGPSKFFSQPNFPLSVSVGIFPDRDILDETHTLTINYQQDEQAHELTIPIRVIDQDRDRPLEFNIYTNFDYDESGFFNAAGDAPATRRQIAQQVADNWAYFLAPLNVDTVPAATQDLWVWTYPNAFHGDAPVGRWERNPEPFTGIYLLALGITCQMPDPCEDTSKIRSTGAPNRTGIHRVNGAPLDPSLWNSGQVTIETQGDYDLNGWELITNDDEWYSFNWFDGENDLYSIVSHEMGHAIAYEFGFEGFTPPFDDAAIVEYHGGSIDTDSAQHFVGVLDRLSQYGIFGNEYGGNTPIRRWMITKLDLLILEATGYTLRETSAFAPLQMLTTSLPDGQVGVAYDAAFSAAGGLPAYDWRFTSGTLPDGLTLDRFTGRITGTPTTSGTSTFDVLLCDYDIPTGCVPRTLQLTIDESDATQEPTAEPTVTIEPTAEPTATTEPTATAEPTTSIERIAPASNLIIETSEQYVSRFQWRANGAEWYAIYITTLVPDKVYIDRWYRAVDVCDADGICTLPPPVWVDRSGNFAWWMTHWSAGMTEDYRDLWHSTLFTVQMPTPGSTTGIAPQGEISGDNIILEWNPAENALWYQLWIGPADYSETYSLDWVNAVENCFLMRCSVTLSENLPPGDYEFWLRAWNPSRMSSWAQMTAFTVVLTN